MKGSELTLIVNTLGRLGTTPGDRSRVTAAPADKPDVNPFSALDEFRA